jgi:hypothetical protein
MSRYHKSSKCLALFDAATASIAWIVVLFPEVLDAEF